MKMGRFDDAITYYGAALQQDAKRATALFGRGVAELRTGATAEGAADIAAAEAAEPGIATRFARYGLTP
jgi:hypothetical protein